MSAAPLNLAQEAASFERANLLAEARRGNCDAFAEMVSPYVSTLYRRARRLTGSMEDAEDVSQEALLKAWSRLEQFSGNQRDHPDDFYAWISRIAANTSIDVLRARRDGKFLSLDQHKGDSEETFGSGIAGRGDNPEERYARREMGQMLADAILRLPAALRQVCLFRDVLHYSTQEVAERLGLSIVAVRLRLFRAHRQLRENLQAGAESRAQRMDGARDCGRRDGRQTEPVRARFVPLRARAGYACGD